MPWDNYPKAASDNAQRALDFKESNGSNCGTAVGWNTARILANREMVSHDRLPRIYSFLSRAKVYDQGDFVDSDGKEICGSIMYAAWGGDEMREWAEKTIQEMDNTQQRAAGERVSFDYDDTLTIDAGANLLIVEQNDGSEIYIISAREDDAEILAFADANDVPASNVFAVGSNDAKIAKIAELGIVRHYDNNADVIDALDGVGILVAPDAVAEPDAAPMVEEKAATDELEIGDFVRWKSGNGFAYGRIIEINADGELSSDSGFVVTGTADNPAALIRIYEFNADEGAYMERTPVLNVVHLFATLEKFDAEVRNNVPVMERRSTEFRAELDGEIVRGYAAVFDSPSEDLGGFIEYIMPGAFDDVLNDDVRAFYNHSDSFLLGRASSGTLRVWQDEKGLGYEVKMPNTTYANDLIELMRRGDVNQSSFAFLVGRDRWEKRNGKNVRIIEKVSRLIDVSPVVLPAYPAATSGLAQREHHDGEVERPNLRDFILRITKLEN